MVGAASANGAPPTAKRDTEAEAAGVRSANFDDRRRRRKSRPSKRRRRPSARTFAPKPPKLSASSIASARSSAPMPRPPRSTASAELEALAGRAAGRRPGAPDAGAARPGLSADRTRRGRQAAGPAGARHRGDEPAVHGAGAGPILARRGRDPSGGPSGLSGRPGAADPARPAADPARAVNQLAGQRAALGHGRDRAAPERRGRAPTCSELGARVR